MRSILGVLILVAIASGQSQKTADQVKLSLHSLSGRALDRSLVHATTDERIRAYQRALQDSPNDSALQADLVSAYLQKLRETADLNYFTRASQLVDKMLDRNGGDFTALRLQNEIDLQVHNFQTVAERAGSMVRYAPSDAGAWGNLGDALMELGEYERAGKAYERMLALRPNLASYNRLAHFRFVTGDADAAVNLMRQATEAGDPGGVAMGSALAENTAWCLAELGDMYFKLGKVEQAADAYRSALGLFPQLHRAYAGLGRVECARGRSQAAITNFERAQSMVPLIEYAGALETLYTSTDLTAKADAQRSLIAAVEKLGKATNEKTNRNLALVLADRNRDLPLALSLIQTELPARGDVYTWDVYSWVLFKLGRLEEARTASRKAIQYHTPEPMFYYHAARIARDAGDDHASQEYFERLKSLNVNFDVTPIEVNIAALR